MMKISATVITLNEEENIAGALDSLSWADEIIVVDSESTDRTVEIARRYTDRVFVRSWPGYMAQKNFAAEQARNDWVFNLDADERVSGPLKSEIEKLRRMGGTDHTAFEMPRKTFYLGRWIEHSGWYPDYKVRLFNRRAARWTGEYVHEAVRADGTIGRLKGDILHYTVSSASDHHERIDRYTTLSALEMFDRGKRSSIGSIFLSPAATFIHSYILKRGFLDGVQGLAISYFAAYYVFLKNLKLWELERRDAGGRGAA